MNRAALPSGWSYVKLRDCCDIVSGATPRRDRPEYWDGDIPWVTPKDLSDLDVPVLEDAPEYITEQGYKSCSTTLLPKGSILFSSRAPIGLVALAGRPMCTNQGFKSLIPGNGVDSGYLYRCMKSLVPRIQDMGRGATFAEISKELFGEVEIPLPKDTKEQKRIAGILDKADTIHRKRQQTIQLADEFLRSVFLDMFGDPRTNPKELDRESLGNLIKLRSGDFLPTSQMNTAGSYLVYGGNGVSGRHDQYMFDEPQLVIGRVGVYCGAIHVTEPCSWVTDNALYVSEISAKLNRKYLEWALRIANLNQYANQAAQPLLSGGRIYPIEILVPSKDDQERFESISASFRATQSRLNELSKSGEELFGSVSQRAFRGEL